MLRGKNVKNITLSADEKLIKKAREKAKQEHTTLNESFRNWLQRYIITDKNEIKYEELMDSLSYVKYGKKFSRDELNER